MKPRRASAALIGAFVVGGLVLVIAALIAAGGGRLFARKERAVMHFSGSIYGLQVGAPVVFRGVPLGTVTSIGLVWDPAASSFSIPVVAELEPRVIRGLGGDRHDPSDSVEALVARGLRAQLSMQSLLTGQLYVDLDLRPDKPGAMRGGRYRGAVEIPTTPTAIQALKNQLENVDLRQLLEDVSAIAASARSVVAGPQLKQALDNVVDITAHVRQLTARLDTRLAPMASAAEAAIGDARRAMDRVGGAADRVGRTADRAGTLLADDAPLVRDLQRTASELAATAAALREHAGEDGKLVQGAERMLQDVSHAARSVRELAELLDRHPEALLRGRRTERAERTAAAPPAEPASNPTRSAAAVPDSIRTE